MTTDNGSLASRFLQSSQNMTGTVSHLDTDPSQNTKQRRILENTIKGVAIKNGKSLDSIVTGILTANPTVVAAYVTAHGEVPFRDPVKLATQATLLRAKDVATQATALDTTDEDALETIEQAEQAAQDINSPDEAVVLPANVQAAMKIAMDHASDLHAAAGGTGQMNDVMNDAARYAIACSRYNNADGDINYADPEAFGDDPEATTSPITTGLATIPIDTGNINPTTGLPTITANPAPSTNTAGIVGSSSNNSGVLGSITSILQGITSAASGVTTAAHSVGTAGNAVNNALGGIGASSITQFFQKNWLWVIVSVIAIILFVVFVVKATGKK